MISRDMVCERLVDWGAFWFRKEFGQGYGSNSVTNRLCETLETQIYSQGTAYINADKADAIIVPDWVEELDIAISCLTTSERLSINTKYKIRYLSKKHKEWVIRQNNLHTDRAETKLCGLI